MKRRQLQAHDGIEPELALAHALGALASDAERVAFLRDLCTPAELEALCDRWRVVAPLWRGEPYREIHELSAVSVTTIGRVARFLAFGNGGYQAAAERLFGVRLPMRDEGAPSGVRPGARAGRGKPQAPAKPRRVARSGRTR